MGRKKIKIQKIADEKSCLVTFSKRKQGLFKKAYELSILCGCDIVLIVFTKADGLYQYASESIDRLLERRMAHKAVNDVMTNDKMKKKLAQRQNPHDSPSHQSGDHADQSNEGLVIDEDYSSNSPSTKTTPGRVSSKRVSTGDGDAELASPKRARTADPSNYPNAVVGGYVPNMKMEQPERSSSIDTPSNASGTSKDQPIDSTSLGQLCSISYSQQCGIMHQPKAKSETESYLTHSDVTASTVMVPCAASVPLNTSASETPLSLLLLSKTALDNSNVNLNTEATELAISSSGGALPILTPAPGLHEECNIGASGVNPPQCPTTIPRPPLIKGELISPPTPDVTFHDMETSTSPAPSTIMVDNNESPTFRSVDLDEPKEVKEEPRPRRRPTLSPLRVPTTAAHHTRSTSTDYKRVPRGTFLDTPEVGTYLKSLEVSQAPLYGLDSTLPDSPYSYLRQLCVVSPIVARSLLTSDPLEQASAYLRLNRQNSNGGHLPNIPMPKTPNGGLETPVVNFVHPESRLFLSTCPLNGSANSTSTEKSA